MRAILLISITFLAFSCFLPVYVYSALDYLNQLTLGDFETHFDEFSKEEKEYVIMLMEEPLEKIMPFEDQQKILLNEYLTLENLMQQLHYTKIWSVEYNKINFYENDYFELYKIQKKEDFPSKTLAYLLFDKFKETYKVIGFSQILTEQFNDNVKIILSSPDEMISYSKELTLLVRDHTDIVEQDLINNSSDKYFERLKENVYPPKIIYQSEKYCILDLFGIHYFERVTVVEQLLVMTTCDGKISIIKENIYVEF